MIYIELFFAFATVGLFSFGGGYAALPLIQDMIVGRLGWMTEAEFANVMVISEMTPGPITINAATFVGTKLGGFGGAVVSTLGFVFPSAIIITLLSVILKKYGNLKAVRDILSVMRPCVIGLIAAAGAKMLTEAIGEGSALLPSADIVAVILFTAALAVIRKYRLSPILTMCSCGVIGAIVYGVIGF